MTKASPTPRPSSLPPPAATPVAAVAPSVSATHKRHASPQTLALSAPSSSSFASSSISSSASSSSSFTPTATSSSSSSAASSRLQQISKHIMSPPSNSFTCFPADIVPQAPEDPLFGLMAAYRADESPDKVDLVSFLSRPAQCLRILRGTKTVHVIMVAQLTASGYWCIPRQQRKAVGATSRQKGALLCNATCCRHLGALLVPGQLCFSIVFFSLFVPYPYSHNAISPFSPARVQLLLFCFGGLRSCGSVLQYCSFLFRLVVDTRSLPDSFPNGRSGYDHCP